MADSLEVFGFCSANCKHRVLTVDQTAALIQEMAANGFQVPEGFIPKTAVNSIVEQNTGKEIRLFIGTQEEYDTWTGDKNNIFAIISDEPALKDILNRLDDLEGAVVGLDTSINNIVDGITPANKAINAIVNSNGTYSGFTHDSKNVLKVGDETIYKSRLIYDAGENPTYAVTLSNDIVKVGDKVEIEYVEHVINRDGSTTTYKSVNYLKTIIPSSTAGYEIPEKASASYINENGVLDLNLSFGRSIGFTIRINEDGANTVKFDFGSPRSYDVFKFAGGSVTLGTSAIQKTWFIKKIYKIYE